MYLNTWAILLVIHAKTLINADLRTSYFTNDSILNKK